MPSTKGKQMCAPVLTYNPKFPSEKLQELLAFIRENKLAVYLSQVSGFGRPELRVNPGQIVEGVVEIARFLEERFGMTAATVKPWTLEGYDTFSGEPYDLPGEFNTEAEAQVAAQKRLVELEETQPSAESGGQSSHGIQDRVFIVRPDGTKYRFSEPAMT